MEKVILWIIEIIFGLSILGITYNVVIKPWKDSIASYLVLALYTFAFIGVLLWVW